MGVFKNLVTASTTFLYAPPAHQHVSLADIQSVLFLPTASEHFE